MCVTFTKNDLWKKNLALPCTKSKSAHAFRNFWTLQISVTVRNFLFQDMKPHVSKVTALFLLSQVFLIITHVPLVRLLAWIIFAGDANIFTERGAARIAEYSSTSRKKTPNFLTVSDKRKTQCGKLRILLSF